MAQILNLILGPHRFETESPWGVLTGICAIFGAVILSLVVSVIVLFGGEAFFQLDTTSCLARGLSDLDPRCSRWIVGLTGLSGAILIVAFCALAYARQGSTPANTLLMRSSGLRWWQYGLMAAAMIGLVMASMYLTLLATGSSEADFEVGIDYLKALVSEGGWLNWLMIIGVIVLIGPIMEEIIFRGFIFTTVIKTRLGFVGAAIITSGLWTLLHSHYKWQLLIVLFMFGCGLAFVVWRTGSLWSGIAVHAANNLTSALILGMR